MTILNELTSSIGAKLVGVRGLLHVLDDEKDLTPIEIEFAFVDRKTATIRGSGNGASMICESKQLFPVQMDDLGALVVEDFSDVEPFSGSTGLALTKVLEIRSKRSPEDVIGCTLVFAGKKFSILNIGDEFHLFSEIPHALISDEGLISILTL